MRFSTLATMLAGAGLALQAGASPIRIVFISESSHNVAIAPPVLSVGDLKHTIPRPMIMEGGKRRGGCGKAVAISNKFRGMFGFPLIETDSDHKNAMPGDMAHILPHHDGNSPVWINQEFSDEDAVKIMPVPRPIGGPHHHHRHPHHRSPSFLRRIHFSLMALGPWEGKAVAFVLGCGLGVLLRMLWVLSVVLYRSIRGPSPESEEYYKLFEQDADAEEILVAPPRYTTYSDEKEVVPVEEERK